MRLNFETVDVFTSRQFGGNPLAVVLNAEGLSTEQMQAIAREFNLAETTFVLPPMDSANTAHVRIFTPRFEMPFAGHPNVGTAFVIGRAGTVYGNAIRGEHLIFEEKAGLVPVDLHRTGSVITSTRVASPQLLSVGAEIPRELISAACTLAPDDIETKHHAPCIASCGAPFILAELKTRDALIKASARSDVFLNEVSKHPVTSILIYARSDEDGIDIRARMFAPHHGIPEDPATGSANVALGGLLAQLRPERDLELRLKIVQGAEMGRPSLLDVFARKEAGKVVATFVGGECAPMLTGSFELK